MKTKISRFPALSLAVVALLATLNSQLSTAHAQGTPFTYQGQLTDGSAPAHGSYDLNFALYDAVSGSAQHGATVTGMAIAASHGQQHTPAPHAEPVPAATTVNKQ